MKEESNRIAYIEKAVASVKSSQGERTNYPKRSENSLARCLGVPKVMGRDMMKLRGNGEQGHRKL